MDLQEVVDAIQNELKIIEERRRHWLGAKEHFESLMRLSASHAALAPAAIPLPLELVRPAEQAQVRTRRGQRRARNGALPMRRAILRVLQDAHGEPLHAENILAQARSLGADTHSNNPVNAVDLQIYGLRDRDNLPVEKVGKRTWRWAGPSDDEAQGSDASRQEELSPVRSPD